MAGGYIGDPPGKRPASPLNQTTAAAAGVTRAKDLAKRNKDAADAAQSKLKKDLDAKAALDKTIAADEKAAGVGVAIKREKREG